MATGKHVYIRVRHYVDTFPSLVPGRSVTNNGLTVGRIAVCTASGTNIPSTHGLTVNLNDPFDTGTTVAHSALELPISFPLFLCCHFLFHSVTPFVVVRCVIHLLELSHFGGRASRIVANFQGFNGGFFSNFLGGCICAYFVSNWRIVTNFRI